MSFGKGLRPRMPLHVHAFVEMVGPDIEFLGNIWENEENAGYELFVLSYNVLKSLPPQTVRVCHW